MTTETTITERDQLRLVIAGSVDDGKSTLVGRLLHDTKSILADQFEATLHASQGRGATEFDFALLTDGLRAEREQGITIDVAYRYFATPRRNFVLADTPGHVQYTRNTVTGASTAEAAVVLVDVRNGVSAQTRRHAAVLSLLRVPQVVFAINKMDAVDWSEERFAVVADDVRAVAERVGLETTHIIPISALTGENVASPGPDWYAGLPLLEVLETLPARANADSEPFRLPVQLVIRPRTTEHPDYRGLAGRVASGTVRVGETVTAFPSGRNSTIVGIDGVRGEQEAATTGESVTIRLADELDVGRGEVLTTAQPIRTTRELDSVLTWLDERPPTPRQRVLVKVGTRTTRALLAAPHAVWHVDDLQWQDSTDPLQLNDIGRIRIQLAEPVAVDDYAQQRATGAFVVIDPDTGATLAAGLTGSELGALAR
ncbi:sulfate adenylyltransferase subunit 1 [Flexivirga endophytica]|uniref:sulfate adenylyltransferase n=1 Tax=Flexivirga endophytica TaxID=1849103 RepID=A0A916TCX5_9MICO|nr:GTP-binding protein [Flexivirga endophytica]GGB40286.1 sulfate adenylyltransferase subunit 1 [Flexivirga endophytica]GHB48120.1 sulfate adenylyltransferase subunit 1 [Flexivirga endophytica]